MVKLAKQYRWSNDSAEVYFAGKNSLNMQYLVFEKFKQDKAKEVYQRFEEKGRLMPDGLHFVNSWINEQVTVCYQVMETDDIDNLHQWINNWNDLIDFEVIPVITSQQAKQIIFSVQK